jgi:hypothetical protein
VCLDLSVSPTHLIVLYLKLLGWPEPFIYTVYDRIFGYFPATNTVYTPYMYGSGQPYGCGCYMCVSAVCFTHPPDGPVPQTLRPRHQAALKHVACNHACSVSRKPVLLICQIPGINVGVYLVTRRAESIRCSSCIKALTMKSNLNS